MKKGTNTREGTGAVPLFDSWRGRTPAILGNGQPDAYDARHTMDWPDPLNVLRGDITPLG